MSGCRVAFSWLTSQVIAVMNAQSWPEGQQITDCTEVLLRDMQVVLAGQQNDEGKSVPHCCRPCFPPHVASCRAKRLAACVEEMAEVRRQKMDTLEILPVMDAILSRDMEVTRIGCAGLGGWTSRPERKRIDAEYYGASGRRNGKRR